MEVNNNYDIKKEKNEIIENEKYEETEEKSSASLGVLLFITWLLSGILIFKNTDTIEGIVFQMLLGFFLFGIFLLISHKKTKEYNYKKYNISMIKEKSAKEEQKNKVIIDFVEKRKKELKTINFIKIITYTSFIIIICSLFFSAFFLELANIILIISTVTFIVFAILEIISYIKIIINLTRQFKKNNINYYYYEVINIINSNL